ncbi:MAG: OmpH family outer membrane protein [Chloroherpetonaceae bacterium]|nr:OmpH family outer membrane protein [Chloroherpetonaceae bacterium]
MNFSCYQMKVFKSFQVESTIKKFFWDIKITFLFLFLISCFPIFANAQQKIGFIDSQAIIDQLPESKDAQRKLELLATEWQLELKRKKEVLDKLFKEYQAKEILYTEEIKKQKQTEIVDAERDINDFQSKKFGPNGEYFQKQGEIMKPIQDRIFQALRRVATDDKYDYIFDRSGEVMLMYANEEHNLTQKVLEKLKVIAPVGNSQPR